MRIKLSTGAIYELFGSLKVGAIGVPAANEEGDVNAMRLFLNGVEVVPGGSINQTVAMKIASLRG